MIGLAVLRNKDIKVIDQLSAFPTLGLMHCVDAVRHLLTLGKSIFITGDGVALGLDRSVKRAGRFQIDLEFCAGLRRLDARLTVIGMFYQRNIALLDRLQRIDRRVVQLNLIILRVSAYRIDGRIQQVAFTRVDLSYAPIRVTNIVLGDKGAIGIRSVTVYQGITFIDSISSACQAGIALCFTGLAIALCHRYPEFLQDVMHGLIGHFVPVDRYTLRLRHHIPYRRIDLFQYEWRAAGNQNIFKYCYAGTVCNCILIYRKPR